MFLKLLSIDQFFTTYWYNFVKKFRWAVIGITIGWSLIAVISAHNYDERTVEGLMFYDMTEVSSNAPIFTAY